MPSETKRLALLDTNLLLDAADPREPLARAAASLIRELVERDRAVVTVQILVEYFDNLTRPKRAIAPLMSAREAYAEIEGLLASVRCLDLTPTTTILAAQASLRYRMRIFDAHIWACAHANGIDLILTRDMPSQRIIEGVQYINPFDPDFTPESIGL